MNKYLMIYRGAVRPEDGKKHMSDWMAWVQSMGDAMIDPGLPVGPAQTVSAQGISEAQNSNPISGISIIQATDLNNALDLVKSCPHLAIGGTIDVAEAMNMSMS